MMHSSRMSSKKMMHSKRMMRSRGSRNSNM
jgi:hypothetical protein